MRAVALAFVVIAVLSAPATAEVNPPGRLSLVVGLRNGTSSLNDAFGLGGLYGMEAAWQPLPEGRAVGYAVHWGLLFGDFGADPAAITGSLDILELSLGARLRLAPRGDQNRILFLGGGVALLRANTALPPDDKRDYVGGFGGFGVEVRLWKVMTTLEVRYGLIGAGPGAISVMLGGGFGV